MNSYKKYTLLGIITPLLLFLFYILIMFFTDPLQLYHKSYFKENALEENMRHQAAGIINTYDFDSIILGNSYMENTSAKQCNTLFGGNFVNISLGGSSNFERSIVLEYALKKKKIKTVISVIDTNTNRTGSQNYPFDLWGMLYDENLINDFRVYFDLHYFSSIFTPARNIEIDRPNAWYKDPWYTARLGGLDNWIENISNHQVRNFLLVDLPNAKKAGLQENKEVGEQRKQEIKAFIKEVMGEQASRYPDTQFIYIFPPFSRLFYAYTNYVGKISEYYYWHEAMLEASETWKNIEVYAFANEEYTEDIKNYIDTNHFDEWIGSDMMKNIAAKKGKITRENIAAYLDLLKENIANFNLESIADYVAEKIQKTTPL